MPTAADIRLLADYNAWMNQRIYQAASQPAAHAAAPRGAFFGSLLGTLNHIAVGDVLWLKRFATHPAGYSALDPVLALPMPTGLDHPLHPDLAGLAGLRHELDQAIIGWASQVSDPDLDHVLAYTNTRGVAARYPFGGLVLHFFNHQTHHRGQATTLLSQAGVDFGATDLLLRVNDTPPSTENSA
ncbi:DinB family protein [Bordetella petrii]|uniref:DinB family protein n=1 Tax=Bordetella petrii TaxID=94624 RepID=UPI001E41701A|nr:DinB family protein [Bordetella petrii]MCD0503002.1 DinB family protein [Bordetella petrii]